jgi:hypothetical protein
MNKNTSMSYYFNKITDLIKNKVYVENGPLESHNSSNIIPGMNGIKKIPLLKETEKKSSTRSIDTIDIKTSEITENQNLANTSSQSNGLILPEAEEIQIQPPDLSLRDIIKTEFNVIELFNKN